METITYPLEGRVLLYDKSIDKTKKIFEAFQYFRPPVKSRIEQNVLITRLFPKLLEEKGNEKGQKEYKYLNKYV